MLRKPVLGREAMLTEAVQAISAEIKPFDAADFRAKGVQDRGGDDQNEEGMEE